MKLVDKSLNQNGGDESQRFYSSDHNNNDNIVGVLPVLRF